MPGSVLSPLCFIISLMPHNNPVNLGIHSVVSDCNPMNCSTPGLPVHQLPESTQTHELVMPSNHLILCCPLLLPPSIFPSIRVFSRVSSLHQVAKVLEFQLQRSVLPMNTQDGSPCSPRDSQKSSPTPQLKSINSSALSFLFSPTLTSICDYWKNHSLH